MVVAYHYEWISSATDSRLDLWVWSLLSNGWIGVDLFFVLSGFLITGILVDSRGALHYLRNFYARRFLRIIPLYYVVLAFIMVGLPALTRILHLQVSQMRSVDWWMYWTHLGNVEQFLHGNTEAALGVTWSLSVEEQFYFVWPFIVLLLPRRALLAACGALLVAEPVARAWLFPSGNAEMFTLAPFHLDGLVVGAAVAVVVREPRVLSLAASVVGRFGLLLVVVAVVWLRLAGTSGIGGPLDFSLLALAFGSIMLLTLVSGSGAILTRALNLQLLRSIGAYSYAIYLFHQIVGQAASQIVQRTHVPTILGSALPVSAAIWIAAFASTYGLAWLSWHLFEGPITSLKRYFPVARGEVQRDQGHAEVAGAPGSRGSPFRHRVAAVASWLRVASQGASLAYEPFRSNGGRQSLDDNAAVGRKSAPVSPDGGGS
jgi:peptidoglycan/LPS O-acetylase OafA/YrhL